MRVGVRVRAESEDSILDWKLRDESRVRVRESHQRSERVS